MKKRKWQLKEKLAIVLEGLRSEIAYNERFQGEPYKTIVSSVIEKEPAKKETTAQVLTISSYIWLAKCIDSWGAAQKNV